MTEPEPRQPATAAGPLEDALAYAFARAALPDRFETSRQYAERIVPLMRESGYIEAEAADASGLPLDVDLLRVADRLRQIDGPHWMGTTFAAGMLKAIAAAFAVKGSAISAEPAGEPRRRFDSPIRCGWCGSKGEHLPDCDNPNLAHPPVEKRQDGACHCQRREPGFSYIPCELHDTESVVGHPMLESTMMHRPPVAGPASEPWVQGDIEPTAILRGGIVRYRVMATGNPKDAEEGTAMIVTALNARPPVAGPDAGKGE